MKKTSCDYATQALVAEGDGLGTLTWVCFDKECREHRKAEYAPTEKEKAKRKKEREQEEGRREKFDAAIADALLRVKWPLTEKHLDALFDLTLESYGATRLTPILKRYDLKADKKVHNGYTERDCVAPIRRMAVGKDEKLRFIFEILLPTFWSHSDDKEMKKKIAKL